MPGGTIVSIPNERMGSSRPRFGLRERNEGLSPWTGQWDIPHMEDFMKTEYPEKILTTKDVAEYCQVTVRRVRTAIRNKEIDYLDFSGPAAKGLRVYNPRFTQSAVDRWLKSILRSEVEPTIL